ncbi:centromere protein B, putative [Ixodes scapularis]|uniref:Centromere protein B, putative n=1 Tax=Ixodes scapularis TaxID=6945 RepID=B7Q7Z9_IXOSC|nr:centromere protein B, putative [Ixodes scapularis]|eukprot:XP_002412252.1 centromere protein B, putative [Ixodes scapularis]
MSLPGPSTPKKEKKALSLKVKRTVLESVRLGLKKSAIAKKYEIPPSTLSTIIKNADKIDAALDNDAACADRKKLRKSMCEEVEAALFKWFLDARAKGIPISGSILTDKARNLGIVGEAASVDDTVLQAWLDKHFDRILATYAYCDIYNADETGLFFQLLPAKTLASEDDKCVGTKTSKERVTVLLCANMDGSDKRKLLVIGNPINRGALLPCFLFPSRCQTAGAGDEAFAGDDDIAVAEISAPLERLWESMAKDQLVASGVDLAIFLANRGRRCGHRGLD